ncbi:MAG: TRAP transporter large permease [Alphaproteobacteria bacterium]|nr:TRAP transporter large permease [Alphaproteobacteria bacterium]
MVTLILFGVMLALFFLSVPIPASLGLAAIAAIQELGRVNAEVVIQRMFFGLDSFLILAVPLFILLGDLMVAARITDRLVAFAQALVGRLPGGLGHVSVVANMLMAGISGSGTADAAATGVVLVPAMEKAGYGRALAAAIVGSAATIGPIIPPSIIMIIYASIAGQSVGRMFIGGVVPGILMGIALMTIVAVIARRRGIGNGAPSSGRDIVLATRRALVVLVMPILVVGGILGGVFTATESAAVAVGYALVIGLFVFRTLGLRELVAIFKSASLTTGKVMFVLATASGFSWILARAGAPQELASLPVFGGDAPAWLILLALNVLLLILGCVMEAIAILLIIVPMILPIALKAGIDPIHLGVVMSFNLTIGLITPPFGSIMFVMCGISRVSIYEYSREALPFVAVLILSLGLITYFPELVLFLPNLVMGKG